MPLYLYGDVINHSLVCIVVSAMQHALSCNSMQMHYDVATPLLFGHISIIIHKRNVWSLIYVRSIVFDGVTIVFSITILFVNNAKQLH